VRPLQYLRPENPEAAVAAMHSAPGGAYLAGGTNLVDHLKLGVTAPDLLVDISRLPLDGIEPTADGGVRIGATVSNTDLAVHPTLRDLYPGLSQALLSGASAQIRNAATVGGNLLQRTRCVYFRDPTTPCNKRDPGSGCAALGGFNRQHAVLGGSDRCVATHPSDMAVAMVALDAVVVVLGTTGERHIPLEEFYRLPGDDPQSDTVLDHDDLVVAVELPPPQNAVACYRKVRDRASYAFALVSVAADLTVSAGTVTGCRLAYGGVATRPWRAHRAEEVVLGHAPDDTTFAAAADAELADARPLDGNAFKVPLLRRTTVAVLRDLTARATREERS